MASLWGGGAAMPGVERHIRGGSATSSTIASRAAQQRRGLSVESLCLLRSQLSSSHKAFKREHRQGAVDLVLSSGFLAFANHSGFLKAVEEAGLEVAGVMGTSAGALAGSLFCAGYTSEQVAAILAADKPISMLRPSLQPWKGGVLSLDGVVERLKEYLPARFEDLQREFAVGVVTNEGKHVIIDKGPLAEAVAASAAIPIIFQGMELPQGPQAVPDHKKKSLRFKDGGCADRIGLKAWRDRRRQQILRGDRPGMKLPPPCIVHVINRSSPFSGFDDVRATGEKNVTVVMSPKAGVNFFSLGEYDDHFQNAFRRARPLVEKVKRDSNRSPDRVRLAA